MKKKLLTLLTVLGLIGSSQAQDSISVGSNNGATPVYSGLNRVGPMRSISTAAWNRCAYLYPSSYLNNMANGTKINSIGFYKLSIPANGLLSGTVSFRIWLKNTTAADLGTTALNWANEIASATLVYQGTSAQIKAIVDSVGGFKKFNLSSPFTYTGDNLEVIVQYTQSTGVTGGNVLWGYDNASTLAYPANTTRFSNGNSATPNKTTLDTADVRHPGLRLFVTSPGCAGIMITPSVSSTDTICQGRRAVISASGISALAGQSILWEESSNGTSWGNVSTGGAGDTTDTYITPILNSQMYYRVKVTCSQDNTVLYSNAIQVTTTPQPSYLPFNMGFNTTTPLMECLSVRTLGSGTATAPSITAPSRAVNYTFTPDTFIQPQEGDRLLVFNSYLANDGAVMRLISPKFNTKGIANILSSYYYFRTNGYQSSTDSIVPEYTTSLSGNVWTPVTTGITQITDATLDSNFNGWQQVNYTYPQAVENQDSVWLSFKFISHYGYQTVVDNWQVTGTPTPVKLTKFVGVQAGNKNKLFWATAIEQNSKWFEIERSANGKDFKSIGTVNTKSENGNSSKELNYAFDDVNPISGDNYYRLKQVDVNGAFTYSSVVKLVNDGSNKLVIESINPNPASTVATLKVSSGYNTTIYVLIADASGKIVKSSKNQINEGTNNINLSVENLKAGSYIVKVISEKGDTKSILLNKL